MRSYRCEHTKVIGQVIASKSSKYVTIEIISLHLLPGDCLKVAGGRGELGQDLSLASHDRVEDLHAVAMRL